MGERRIGKNTYVACGRCKSSVRKPDCQDELCPFAVPRSQPKPKPTETVLRHDPDSGCTYCPLLDCGMCRALYDEDRDVITLVGPDAGTLAPAFCPLRKGRVVVEASDG